MTPPPFLELFRKFIPFGTAVRPWVTWNSLWLWTNSATSPTLWCWFSSHPDHDQNDIDDCDDYDYNVDDDGDKKEGKWCRETCHSSWQLLSDDLRHIVLNMDATGKIK